MFDFFKILAEEPEKIRKSIFLLLKFILCSILTSCLYILIFGNYKLISMEHPIIWSELFDFIISGKVIIVAFIYLVCNTFLFDLLPIMPNHILDWILNKVTKKNPEIKDNKLIRIILERLKVINIDKEENIKIGKNFKEFYEILFSFHLNGTKAEVYEFKNSLMNQTLKTYYGFVFVFYLCIDFEKSIFLNCLIAIGFTINILFYICLHFIIFFFDTNGDDILNGLKGLNTTEQIDVFFAKNNIKYSKTDTPIKNNFSRMVYLGNKEIIIDFYYGNFRLSSRQIQRFINVTLNNDKKNILILSNQKLTTEAKKLVKENKNIISVLCYEDEIELKRKLFNQLAEKRVFKPN